MAFAAFDLDGTLYTGHIIPALMRYHVTHRVKVIPLSVYMAVHMPLWPLWRLGLVSEGKARELWSRHMPWTIRGWTPQEAAPAFEWIAEHYVRPLVRPAVMARLRHHQAAGDRVIMVSGTTAPLLAEIGRQLGIQETVGTPAVLKAGRYSGACELPVCQGEGKVARLKEYLADDDSGSWRESYAYADSYSDLPLLLHVGHPVAVCPDPHLAACARSLRWEVMTAETASPPKP